jgi:cytidylate kinase
MRYRVLTVDREFGSGGGRIAETIAKWLEWKLLDEAIIDEIAYAAHVDKKVVRQFDEHVDTWLQRLNRRTMRSAVLAAGLELRDGAVFNPDEMTKLTEKIIEQGYAEGNCVIVGRGAQCILRHKQDAYHVFVYASRRERILRLRKRLEPSADVEEHLGKMDGERARYVQERFGKCWTDPHLYDLMISSHEDEGVTARVILNAMQGAPVLAQTTQ